MGMFTSSKGKRPHCPRVTLFLTVAAAEAELVYVSRRQVG
jgi:hypothetical protein